MRPATGDEKTKECKEFCRGILRAAIAKGLDRQAKPELWNAESILVHLKSRALAAQRGDKQAQALIDQPDGDTSDDDNDEREEGAHH